MLPYLNPLQATDLKTRCILADKFDIAQKYKLQFRVSYYVT